MIKDFLGWETVLLEGQPLGLAINIGVLLFGEFHALVTTEKTQRNAETGPAILHDNPVVIG